MQKHAKAGPVSVQLDIRRTCYKRPFPITGSGSTWTQCSAILKKWDHFGIRGILERARLVGGEATIDSKKDAARGSCCASR